MGQTRETIILASGSPRRRCLLETARFNLDIRVPNADETWPGGTPQRGTVEIARRKLECIGAVEGLVLAADTVVVLGDERLGKPRDAADAVKMLQALSDCEHQVVTGFCLSKNGVHRDGAVTTRVWFRKLTQLEIDVYVQSTEPWDKAGAYAIQGAAGAFIDRIEGSYTNVVGLPVAEVIAAAESLS